MGLFKSIKNDIDAIIKCDPAASSVVEVVLAYPGFHARNGIVCTYTLQMALAGYPRLISHCSRFFTGIEIHPGAKIGEGFNLSTTVWVWLSARPAEIGDNVTLYQGVTLGGTSHRKVKRHPTLGNNVMVGVGAQVIGAITIGDNTKIGAAFRSDYFRTPQCHRGRGSRESGCRPQSGYRYRERLPDPVWEKMD